MKIWARWPYSIHLSVVFPSRMPAGPHFVTQPILLSETFLIFDINHQQNTRRSDQIETIKMIMHHMPRITWKVYQWLRLPFLKKYSIKGRKRFRLWIVLFWTKTSQRLTLYLLFRHTDNIHIVLENDNTVLIKDLKGVNKQFSRNTHLIENVSW